MAYSTAFGHPVVCVKFSRKPEPGSGHGMLVMFNVTNP
jgi:hypothetical protein